MENYRQQCGFPDRAHIQYQSVSGHWTTVQTVSMSSAEILLGMHSVARMMPGCRVRAVDDGDRVLDIL